MGTYNFKKDVITTSLKDIKVELDEEFDNNFQRKAFFNMSNKWAKKKYDDGKGSLLVRSGALRRSLSSVISGDQLVFSSSVPYAAIHNEGGEITVTEKMKRFFWYKYSLQASRYGYKKDGTRRNDKRNARLSDEAEFYRAMALKKVGDKIKIPQRRFIGDSPEVQQAIRSIVEQNIQEFFTRFTNELKR